VSRITASRLALLQSCQYWARPDAVWNEAPPGRAAQFGTDLHALSDVYVRGELREGSAVIADERLAATWRHMRAWHEAQPGRLASEWPLAWDPETDRAFDLRAARAKLGVSAARPYADPSTWALLRAELGFGPDTIAGTADLIAVEGARVVVYDICTGRTDKIAQLRGLAMMLAKLSGCDEVRIATLRANPAGLAEEDHGVLDCFTIEAIAEDLRALIARVPRSEPRTGEHCTRRYCPAQRDCPGFGDLTAPG
jgi:hypothetical protein